MKIYSNNLKDFFRKYQSDIYLGLILVLVSMLSFNLGRIFTLRSLDQPLRIEQANISEIIKQSDKQQETGNKSEENSNKLKANQLISFKVVASKNGTKYHFLWCPGAKKIKPENLINFNSEQEAQSKGYTLAANCAK